MRARGSDGRASEDLPSRRERPRRFGQTRHSRHALRSAPAAPDASTGTNEDELRRLGISNVVATFPRQTMDEPGTRAAAAKAWAALGLT